MSRDPVDVLTPRLRLTRPRAADVASLHVFLGDPAIIRHTHLDADLAASRRRVLVHEWRRRRHGVAPWTIRLRDDDSIVGWGGLYIDPFDATWGVELAYFFHSSVWGQGLASELAQASVALADTLRLPSLIAFAHPANAASLRVLERAGFAGQRYIPQMQRFLLDRPPATT